MTAVSAENRTIAKYILNSFGGTPSVQKYHHDTETFSVDVLRCDDRPFNGVSSYSTIGLSDYLMLEDDGTEFSTRLEIAATCATEAEFLPNIVASAAFCVMRTRSLYSPGRVMPGYIREYYPNTTVPHLYFTAPFLWESSLTTLECETKKVSWLLVVPISDGELDYLRQHGDDALESLFEKHETDIFDLNRESV